MDNARLTALRARMAEAGIDAYIVPTADDHESEYVGEHYKARAFSTSSRRRGRSRAADSGSCAAGSPASRPCGNT